MVKNVISTKACFFASKSVGFLNEAILPIFLKFEANLTGLLQGPTKSQFRNVVV